MQALPRAAVVRLFAVWLLVAVLGALGLGAPGGQTGAPVVTAAVLFTFGLAVALGARSSLYLAAARAGLLRVDESAPPHRLWRLAPLSLVAGAALAAPGVGLGALLAWLSAPRLGLLLGAVVVAAAGFEGSRRLVARDLARPVRPRSSSLLGWLLVDTALPAALLAAGVGAGIGWLRLGGLDVVSPAGLARHVAVTLFVYALLLGPAGALKAGRERLAGLVVAPVPGRSVPGPFVVGGVLGVVVLAVGPRVLPAMAPDDVIALKAGLGFVVGGALCALGAWRGARVVEERR